MIMEKSKDSKTMYRVYANMFSTSRFRKLVEEQDVSYLLSKYALYDAGVNNSIVTIRDYYKHIYNTLLSSYRNEYIYKNLIINKILLGRHNLNTATVLNEFRVGKSVADLILLNGVGKVYEIKTELDSLFRLDSQIADYRKVFGYIYIVTHISLADKYANSVDDTIGIIALTDNKTLKTIREATLNMDYLDSSTIIKCLRKVEYSNIIKNYFGAVPQTTPVKYYSACKELFAQIPRDKLHGMMLAELKKRTIKEKDKFTNNEITPQELKYLFWNLDFNDDNYQRFSEVMNFKLAI